MNQTKSINVTEPDLYILRAALSVFRYQMNEDAKNDPKRIDLFMAQTKTADLLRGQVNRLLDELDPKRHNVTVQAVYDQLKK
jgi:hypothetical protein